MNAKVTECNVSQIDDHRTIRCELMAMKQKDRGFVVRNGEREKRRGKIFSSKMACTAVVIRFLEGIQMR